MMVEAAGLQKGGPDEAPREWDLPVDSEHKAKCLKLHSFKAPHMRSFHCNWLAFFAAFTSTFAAAPLIIYIRQDLNLNKAAISGASIAAVTGTIFARVAMGTFCDSFGPRFGQSFLLLLTSSAVFGIALVESSAGFIICRCIIGFSLACFVCCQFWTSVMFSPNVVGSANAFAAGWGNVGGGFTQLIMPLIVDGIKKTQPTFLAWRWAFFVPGGMQIVIALIVLIFAQDLPDGNFADCRKKGSIAKANKTTEFWVAVRNYRMWVLLLTYGYCFGVELTIDNNLAQYFHDQFNLSTTTAGYYAAIFGLFNIISRPLGGIISDALGRPFGIRGRLWWAYGVQLLGGFFCLAMGLLHDDLATTLVVLCFFSFFIQAACGATYGVVPFVSKRALGLVSGLVGAGGNAGSAVTQAIFFTPASLATYDGFKWMGIMIIGITQLFAVIWFPAWGGMLFPAKKGATEEAYYYSEFTATEREQGLHLIVTKFAFTMQNVVQAMESKSQRGMHSISSRKDVEEPDQAPATT